MSRRRKPPSRKPDPKPGKAALCRFLATCTPEEERALFAEICVLAIERQIAAGELERK
jgi:hypothetical protein